MIVFIWRSFIWLKRLLFPPGYGWIPDVEPDPLVIKALDCFPHTRFILADPSSAMLDISKGKLAGVERVQFLDPAASEDLKFHCQVDVITAIQAHHYLTNDIRRKATRVCYDLLKEAGVYVTFENTRPFTEKGVEIGLRNLSNFQLAQGRDIVTVRKNIKRFDTEYFPITIEDHLNLLRECGFQTVELFWFSYMQAGFYCIK